MTALHVSAPGIASGWTATTVETTLKRNRKDVEQRVRRTLDEQTNRAQDFVDQVGEQLSALR